MDLFGREAVPIIATTIGSIIGLLTASITIFANAILNRKAEARRLAQERRNIVSALKAEIDFNRTLLSDFISFSNPKGIIEKFEPTELLTNPDVGEIFARYLPQVGSLKDDTIKSLIKCYNGLKNFPHALFFYELAERSEKSNVIRIKAYEHTDIIIKDVIKDADEALRRLNTELNPQKEPPFWRRQT